MRWVRGRRAGTTGAAAGRAAGGSTAGPDGGRVKAGSSKRRPCRSRSMLRGGRLTSRSGCPVARCRPPCPFCAISQSSGPLRRDRPEPPRLEVLERLQDLELGVHDERAAPRDRLADRPTTEQQHLERRMPAVLDVGCGERDRVAGAAGGGKWRRAEYDELPRADGAALRTGVPAT